MEWGQWKPFLTALILPPTGLLLLMALGLALVLPRKIGNISNKKWGLGLIATAMVLLWLLSCNGMAVLLSQFVVKQYTVVVPQTLAARKVQAIVVLGAGVQPVQPEYGEPQVDPISRERLRYAAYLAAQSRLPLAFSGGVGWAADPALAVPEGDVASQMVLKEFKTPMHWVESGSRDTKENAEHSMEILGAEKITRIALVTHAWHMPRAERDFKAAGFQVLPAPMGFIHTHQRPVLNWLPSAQGLQNSTRVLREFFGLLFT